MSASFDRAPMGNDDSRDDAVVQIAETSELIAPARQAMLPSTTNGRRYRRIAGVAAVAVCGVAGVALRNTAAVDCVASGSNDFVSLAESDPEELLKMPEGKGARDAMARWLEASEAASKALDDSPRSHELRERAEKAVEKAMSVSNKTAARDMVKTAMNRAVTKWQTKRRNLKSFIDAVGAPKHGLRGDMSPSEKANYASCTFDVLQATTQMAALATNINDAAKTCKNVKDAKTLGSWYGKVCSINMDNILFSVASVASSLALAANNCAETFHPNIDALCAGSITGIIQLVMQLSVSADLAASACRPDLTRHIPESVTPANIGQEGTPEAFGHRRLEEKNATEDHGRRLLFGGGIEADATFCGVDVTSVMWYLAQAGLAINSAANPKAGAACPPRGSAELKGPQYRQSQAFCTVDIAGAIYAFLQSIYFLNFAVVHCSDTLNTNAMCGAGVDGILATAAGVAYAGSSMHLTCKEFTDHFPAIGSSPDTVKNLANNVLGNSGNFGRRLAEDGMPQEAVEGVKELQQQFANPEEVWKSMGYDIEGDDALRDRSLHSATAADVASLVQEVETKASDSAGASRTCN